MIDIFQEIKAPTILVAGNHDKLDDLRMACQAWDAAQVLHGEEAIINGTVFFGLGMETSQRAPHPWNSFMSEDDAALALSKCPDHAMLVTHSPPFGGPCDLQASGDHEGARAIAAANQGQTTRFVPVWSYPSFLGHKI